MTINPLMRKLGKKGQLGGLVPMTLSLVVVGVILAVGLLVLSTVMANSTVSADATAREAVNTTIKAVDDVPGWLGIIVIALIGGVVLAIIVGAFRMVSR